ncbi:MAG: hypothetical protein ACOYM8_11075 [Caulobacterales bacterium]
MTSLPLPPDPDGLNASRAAWAFVALRAFSDACRTDWEDALTDLLCDLMHLADRAPEFDFGLALERAQRHYEAETAGEVL